MYEISFKTHEKRRFENKVRKVRILIDTYSCHGRKIPLNLIIDGNSPAEVSDHFSSWQSWAAGPLLVELAVQLANEDEW